jgi:DNA-binding response OmpR family regulator
MAVMTEERTQERILVIEDETDIAMVLKARLMSAGYEVHTEPYGSVGLSYAADNLPDLVILDVRLPDLSGYEVCQELRKLCPPSELQLPVIMFTVMDDPVDHSQGFSSGATAYLHKTCAPTELLNTVDELLHTVN